MNFFFDRCCPIRLCAAVAALEESTHEAYYHDHHFEVATKDPEWIRAVGKWNPKPVVISGDTRILKRPDEMRALVETDLTFVCLTHGWTELPIYECTWMFFKAWPEIVKQVGKCKSPTVFEVTKSGTPKVEIKHLTRDLANKIPRPKQG